jgi:anti-sigma B factor antagonist
MDFDLAASNRGDTYVISVCGDVDVCTAPRLDACIMAGMDAGSTSIALDLANCTYFDSEGIKVLLRAVRRSRQSGSVIIVGALGSVRRVFEISGLDEVFRILPCIEDLPSEPASATHRHDRATI